MTFLNLNESHHFFQCFDQYRVSQWLTLSLGIACTIPSDEISPYALIGAADQALYLAKQQGRACYYCVQEMAAI
ncbi:diguanylate cyclase domain-containing protein [Planktothrix agardhii]|uniref:diguanylate cyclase domain-containing protein n=1 Tax=Planktothrix agardhii TaxID=1160 RepID=UPI001D09CBD4|nr:diguanylate cyclase [Planktothrix agardhii]MCB8749257.1 diguanylate cyclase [Planktothrix agardhii 1810]MCB8757982.1 diguanylate cyclase [Planktothrix agardhii 1813]MCB8758019.1 diguanylate cyclase [Planktothrix agardhii 1813]MCB8766864.1 diguanylate cyclase [Planktothrix agardhii 1809]MCB8779865.1 diguanylate cyclase [Planktothrix agardhii 1031]